LFANNNMEVECMKVHALHDSADPLSLHVRYSNVGRRVRNKC
jgi:hypothetical protein